MDCVIAATLMNSGALGFKGRLWPDKLPRLGSGQEVAVGIDCGYSCALDARFEASLAVLTFGGNIVTFDPG